jgi:multiple sugar transport system permease protein
MAIQNEKMLTSSLGSRFWPKTFRQRDQMIGMLFVVPLVIHFALFFIYPTLAAFFYSFTEWNMRTPPVWVGLQNYQALFFDRVNYPFFWHSLFVSLQYTLLAVPLAMITALTLALMVNGLRKGQEIFKIVFYLPVVTAEAAVATLWRWIYDPLYGLLNMALGWFGLPTVNWLGEAESVIPALAIIAAWQCGGAFLIFLAGLKGIPTEYYEAAELDGADSWQKFSLITIPLLRPTSFYLLLTGLIGAFQVFGLVYVLFGSGGGGPENAGLTYIAYLFSHAFRYNEMGIACAMSFILFVIIILVTYVQFKVVPEGYE